VIGIDAADIIDKAREIVKANGLDHGPSLYNIRSFPHSIPQSIQHSIPNSILHCITRLIPLSIPRSILHNNRTLSAAVLHSIHASHLDTLTCSK
jgi:hypothetical protein